MVIINHMIFSDHIEIEVRGSYSAPSVCGKLRQAGFKYNKVRRMFFKTYYNKEYIKDFFLRDVALVKQLWDGHFKMRTFKLINEETSYETE
jgi:hypothetical protein